MDMFAPKSESDHVLCGTRGGTVTVTRPGRGTLTCPQAAVLEMPTPLEQQLLLRLCGL